MKKTSLLTLIAAALILLAACHPANDPKDLTKGVTVTTADPTFVGNTTATLGAEVTANDAGLLLELGVCWSPSENPTVNDRCSKTYRCSQPYQCFVGNLEPNTVYHVRGYAKYGTEYCYGSEKTFTTDSGSSPAPVATLEAYDITATSFCSGAVVIPFGATNWYGGVCYSTQPVFTIEDCEGAEIGVLDNNGICQTQCRELMPSTQYYYRAFVAYNDGTDNGYNFLYGNIRNLTTPELPFILELDTYNPEYHWGDYMIAYGGGYCTKPWLINQIGFCYSKTNEYPQYESDLYTIAASPTGEMNFSFSNYISNLSANSKYYVRSYARYMTDSIKYGNIVTVDTY